MKLFMFGAHARSFCSALLIFLSQSTVAALSPGDLIISEVMANPSAVSDTAGEWFEIFNTSSNDIDLNGLVIRDNGSNTHTLSDTGPLLISSGDYFVLGRNSSNGTNGGYTSNYSYGNSFVLSNGGDAIILEFGGLEIDSLIYSSAALFGVSGNSAELLESGFALTPNTLIYGDGDIGTPGYAGSYTPVVSDVPIPAAGLLWLSAALGTVLVRKRSLR